MHACVLNALHGTTDNSSCLRVDYVVSVAACGMTCFSTTALQTDTSSVPSGTSSQASHEDAKAVHSLLKTTFQVEEATAQWFNRCQSVFCWSQFFVGSKRLHIQAAPDSNGASTAKDQVAHLSLNGHIT